MIRASFILKWPFANSPLHVKKISLKFDEPSRSYLSPSSAGANSNSPELVLEASPHFCTVLSLHGPTLPADTNTSIDSL